MPLPSPAQIALALIVLKSKPNGMSLEDYFGQLRQHVLPRSSALGNHEHLDSIAFWKQAYEESEAAQAKLLDRIYELEQDQSMANNALTFVEMSASPVARNRHKRKSEAIAKANSQSKRRTVLPKTPPPPNIETRDSPCTEEVNEPDEPQSCSVAFMRHFFNLRQQIVSKRPETFELHQALRDLCRVAAALISSTTPGIFSAEPSKDASAQASTSYLQSTVLAVRRSYPSIMLGLDKLCAKSHGPGEAGSVVYEAIVLFETTLAKINTLAIQEARGTDQSKPKAKATRAKSRARKKSQTPSSEGHHAALQSLAHLAVTMLTNVDRSKASQSQILEGCLYAFLDHLGSSLSLAVFTDNQSPEQHEMFTGFLPPQGLQDLSNLDSGHAIRAVQLEAPYLIHILEEVVTVVDSHNSLMKEKLQNTLLKGVFGDDDDNSSFRNALQRPMRPETGVDENRPFSPVERTPEWFTSEVWRILGWNILASEDASF